MSFLMDQKPLQARKKLKAVFEICRFKLNNVWTVKILFSI